MDAIWTLVQGIEGAVLVESWWYRPRDLDFVQAGLEAANVSRVIELWCDVPAEIALGRFQARKRSPLFEDDRKVVEEWPQWARQAQPLGVGPILRVDTTLPVDVGDVAVTIHAWLENTS